MESTAHALHRNRPIRILALTNDSIGSSGGIAQYNRDFVAALAEAGQFEIVMLPRVGPARAQFAACLHEAKPLRNRAGWSLRALMHSLGRFDIVFCGHLHLAAVAQAAAFVAGAKLVIQLHGDEAWNSPSALIRNAVESADLVLSVSRYTRKRVLSWAAIAPERIVVVTNTVDPMFTPGSGAALRREWSLDGKFVLLSVGRMAARERYKGHDRVIAALPTLLRQNPDIVYVVLGDGDDAERIRGLAASAGLSDRVLFKGAVTRERLVDAYRMADLFIMPSTGEGFGIVFLESMACGTPAFGLAVGGAVDALCDGELGVAAAESEFLPELLAAIRRERPDANALAAAVQARFGHPVFQPQIRRAITACVNDGNSLHGRT